MIVLQVEDVSKWSPRMREPMEAVYGVEGFPKLWFETKKLKNPDKNSMIPI